MVKSFPCPGYIVNAYMDCVQLQWAPYISAKTHISSSSFLMTRGLALYRGQVQASTGGKYRKQVQEASTVGKCRRQVQEASTGGKYRRQVQKSNLGGKYRRQVQEASTGDK